MKLLGLGLMLTVGLIPARAQTFVTLPGSDRASLDLLKNGAGVPPGDGGNCGFIGCSFSGGSWAAVTGPGASGRHILGGSFRGTVSPITHALAGSLLANAGPTEETSWPGRGDSSRISSAKNASLAVLNLRPNPLSAPGHWHGQPANGKVAVVMGDQTSMMLFGSGLLLLGGVLRRKNLTT